MKPFVIRVALILCLMLTGIGLGVARGQVQIAGQIVLCTGEGVVTVSAPHGAQGTQIHICPDMALHLLATGFASATAIAMSWPPVRRLASDHVAAMLAPQDRPALSARDPPDHGENQDRVFS